MSANALAVQQDSVVANLQRASLSLAEAKTIQQTKKIMDVAAAAEIYAKRQQLGEEAVGIATSIKLDALRKLGEMLRAAPKAKGAAGPGRGKAGSKSGPAFNDAPTLAELGLDKKTSAVAQKLAELPQEAFEQVREGHETIAKAIAAVKEAQAVEQVTGKRPGTKPKQPEPPSDAPDAEPEYTEMDALRDQVDELQSAVSVAHMKDSTPEEKALHIDLVANLRAEIKTLTATLAAVKSSRDHFQAENAELRQQIKRQRKEIDKLAGTKTA